MKLTYVLLLTFLAYNINVGAQSIAQSTTPVVSASPAGLSGNVSLSINGTTLEVALTEIARQTGIRMVFGEQVYAVRKKVVLNANNISAREAIAAVIRGTGIGYTVSPTGTAFNSVETTVPVTITWSSTFALGSSLKSAVTVAPSPTITERVCFA